MSSNNFKIYLERPVRIELTSLAWKAKVIAFIRWSHKMAGSRGFEPLSDLRHCQFSLPTIVFTTYY